MTTVPEIRLRTQNDAEIDPDGEFVLYQLCRCNGYPKIIQAIRRASEKMKK